MSQAVIREINDVSKSANSRTYEDCRFLSIFYPVFQQTWTLHYPSTFNTTSNMYPRQLSRQDTLPADDPVWTKPPHVPSLPIPIPPHNEPSISSYIMSDIGTPNSTPQPLPQTIQPAEADVQTMLAELSLQDISASLSTTGRLDNDVQSDMTNNTPQAQVSESASMHLSAMSSGAPIISLFVGAENNKTTSPN
ncbi:hypothetical protein BYT27DRAFT_7253125 [Phlegmacium glaucopus]|nr:hypothetical protein BYT27DRAFT_7253125 [Phlegmacium glaucopus]